jgi:hypothetical protein
MQTDPAGYSSPDANLYYYLGNAPESHHDPLGMVSQEFKDSCISSAKDFQKRHGTGIDWSTCKPTKELVEEDLPGGKKITLRRWECKTEKGTTINVYTNPNDKGWYQCHGLTFGGTWGIDGTCAYPSGDQISVILEESWTAIDCNKVRPGDIMVWFDPQGRVQHSAWLCQTCAPPLDASKTFLVTKNGQYPLDVMSLADVDALYRGFHHKCYHRK